MQSYAVRARGLAGLTVLAAALCAVPTASAAAAAPNAASQLDRAFVRTALVADRCLMTGHSCEGPVGRLQVAGRRAVAVTATPRAKVVAKVPVLSVDGTDLSWTAVPAQSSYVLRTAVPGRTETFSVVRGTRVTVRPVAGKVVTYRVRAVRVGSSWSTPRSISFVVVGAGAPAGGTPVATAPTTTTTTRTTTTTSPSTPAPATTSAPAPAPATSTATPAPAASAPATATTTAAPASTTTTAAATTPASAPTPAPASAPAPRGVRVGINVGSAILWQLPTAAKLGATSARMAIAIGTPVSEVAEYVGAYADAGIRVLPIAEFTGRTPSDADVANLAAWAAAFGPGGTFWKGRTDGAAMAIDRIEFGNESSGPWQYAQLAGVDDWPHDPRYAAIAEGYGRQFGAAATQIAAANSGVRLLAVADVAGRWSQWMDGLFRGDPSLARQVGGWVVHPYGPDGTRGTDDALAQAAAHGASASIPIYITETGMATDDGRCLDDNYGWDRCLGYSQAASTLTSSVAGLRSRYGSRIAELDLYSASDLRDPGQTTDREAYFGALTASGQTKGAYTTAVRAILASGTAA